MLINCQFDAAKVAPNTKSNKFEYNKLKASRLTLDVANQKAYSHIMYCELRVILSWKITEIEF